MDICRVELFWLPVGAGTRVQWASLFVYGRLLGVLSRKPRRTFVHAALKVVSGGRTWTLELMPIPTHPREPALVSGAVGSRFAGHLRIFRYQLLLRESDRLPDEQWAIGGPVLLTTDSAVAQRILDTARDVPANTWGRRAPGTHEMWTSDSAISWLLCRVGIDAASILLPPGTQAPGWLAGIEAAPA